MIQRMNQRTAPQNWGDTLTLDHGDTTVLALEKPVTRARSKVPYRMPRHLPLWRWWEAGLRAAFFLSPATGPARPGPTQVLVAALACAVAALAASRLWVAGSATLNISALLASLWPLVPVLWAGWFALPPYEDVPARDDPLLPQGVASWCALSLVASLPPLLATLGVAAVRQWAGLAWLSSGGAHLLVMALAIWSLLAVLWLTLQFSGAVWRLAVLALVVLACAWAVVGLASPPVWQGPLQARAPSSLAAPPAAAAASAQPGSLTPPPASPASSSKSSPTSY